MANNLQDYLVAIGFRVDEPSFHQFTDFLRKSDSILARLSLSAAGTALAVEAMISRIAEQQLSLYFVSQRTGASVLQLQAFEFAATRVGLSADEARGSVEGFAAALRANPGNSALYTMLMGGKPPSGNAAEDQLALVGRLRHMPDYIAQVFASQFGLDARAYINMKNNYKRLKEFEEDATKRRRDAGVATKEATQLFVEYSELPC